jgi:signal transduction histidine kinase/ActR/RegA family two-component response regulator
MIAAGAVVYWQGRAVLVTRVEEQILNEAKYMASLLEQSTAEAIARVRSLAGQPVMARILDDDEDHEIAELLAVAVNQSRAITELTCFGINGRAIASTNVARLSANAVSPVEKTPDGLRYVLTQEPSEERILLPIVQQFDEIEQIGHMMAVIDRRALMDELNAWWIGLVSESGNVLVDGGEHGVDGMVNGVDRFVDPELGIIRITRVAVTVPDAFASHPWTLAVATPYAERFQPIRVLGLMITMVTLFSSVLVLGVVRHFSLKQQNLLVDLSEQCKQLEEATLEIEGQKEEAVAISQELLMVNEQLEEAKVEATRATQAKSDFLANMSHEIRTPMTAILGFAENLKEGDLSDAEQDHAVETIHTNGEYLLSIINDILDLSKVEAGKMSIERTDFEPCRILAEVASLMRVRADARDVPLNVEYVGAIPETIRSDSTRLRQILINLIGNAIKFTEAGAVRMVTQLVDNVDGTFLQFDVIDTGRGMTEEQVAKLFQPFMQADTSTTREFGGTGLGLTISKRFAELLGGDIAIVATELGVGTTFRVTVATGSLDGVKMLDDPMSATVTADTPRSVTPISEYDWQGVRILLAEDNPTNQVLVSGILRKSGAEIVVVQDGKLALEAALAARDDGVPFDVVLMDMQMPVMDGYEATRELRQSGYTGSIIALTAHAMASDREKCIRVGCDDFATKPINRRELIATIEKYVAVVEA